MNYNPDTIAAVSSGMVRAGVAVIRVSGTKALAIAERLFSKPLTPRVAALGNLYSDKGVLLDSVLALYFPAPHSFTGEDVVEFHCHGSPAVAVAVLRAIFACGARQALAGEFTKRAFLNNKLDLIQAEAVADLIDAETEQAAVNAASMLSGTVSKELVRVYNTLSGLLSHFYAAIDFPDEDIEPQLPDAIAAVVGECASVLRSLETTYERGRIVKNGLITVLVGKPNVGKSSLLNALVGYDRAIVTDTPGTTRDTVEERAVVGGVLLRLTDTAGVRDSVDEIERLGVERSTQALESADLVLVVLDGSASLTDEDYRVLNLAERSGKPTLLLANKCDLGIVPPPDIDAVPVSAKTREGFERLAELVAEIAGVSEQSNTALLSNERQYAAVKSAADILEGFAPALTAEALDDIEAALSSLAAVLGRRVSEDVVNGIFSRFCVGK
jgi:tRNA modification GTPase